MYIYLYLLAFLGKEIQAVLCPDLSCLCSGSYGCNRVFLILCLYFALYLDGECHLFAVQLFATSEFHVRLCRVFLTVDNRPGWEIGGSICLLCFRFQVVVSILG